LAGFCFVFFAIYYLFFITATSDLEMLIIEYQNLKIEFHQNVKINMPHQDCSEKEYIIHALFFQTLYFHCSHCLEFGKTHRI